MEVFLASFVVFVLAILGMSVGTIFGGRPFQGSCRGTCGHCGHTPRDGCQDAHNSQHDCQHRHAPEIRGDDVG